MGSYFHSLPSLPDLSPSFSDTQQDKNSGYSSSFGNTIKLQVSLHSPSKFQFTPTLTWPEAMTMQQHGFLPE